PRVEARVFYRRGELTRLEGAVSADFGERVRVRGHIRVLTHIRLIVRVLDRIETTQRPKRTGDRQQLGRELGADARLREGPLVTTRQDAVERGGADGGRIVRDRENR